MKVRTLLLFVASVFLAVTIVDFFSFAFQLRLFGQNILNSRLWQFILVLVLLLSNSKAFLSKPMLIVYLYSAIYTTMTLLGHYRTGFHLPLELEVYKLLPIQIGVVVLLKEHYFRQDRHKDLKILIIVAWLAYIIACISSLLVIISNPGSVRGTEEHFLSGRDSEIGFRALGLSGYGVFSTLPFLLPILAYYYKQYLRSDFRKTILILSLIFLILVTSYSAVLVAPFMLSVIAITIAMIGRHRMKANIGMILLLLMIYILTPMKIIGHLFLDLSDVVPNREMSVKLHDIGNTYITGVNLSEAQEGSTDAVEHRASRISSNLDLFFRSPIIGAGNNGNPHLYWLYLLARFGIIGVFPLVWLLVSQFKIVRQYDEEYRFFYLISVSTYVLLGFLKGSGSYHFFLSILFLVPGSYYLTHDFDKRSTY